MRNRGRFYGIVLLFCIYSLFLIWCTWYASSIAPAMLFRNYRTIQYVAQMEGALVSIFVGALGGKERDQTDIKHFEENLNLERQNITEPGEGELVDRLEARWKVFIANPATPSQESFQNVAHDLKELTTLNEKAMYAMEENVHSFRYTVLVGGLIGFFLFVVYAFTIASTVTETGTRGESQR